MFTDCSKPPLRPLMQPLNFAAGPPTCRKQKGSTLALRWPLFDLLIHLYVVGGLN